MRMILLLAGKEWRSTFFSPMAYVLCALFTFGIALQTVSQMQVGMEATLRPVFNFSALWMMTFLIPAISMRLLSEEMRQGTLEKLMTSPLADAHIVLGKWMGAMVFIACLLSPLLLCWLAMEWVSSPDPGPIVSSFVGLFLLTAMQLSIGIFCSALTSNQVIALLLTIAILAIPSVGLTPLVDDPTLAPRWRALVDYVSIELRYKDFSRGVIDLTHFAFFISITLLFLIWATLVLHSKRWRG